MNRTMEGKEHIIQQWLNCGEYKTEIDLAFSNILRKTELSKSESETSGIFEQELYYLIRSKTGVEIDIHKEAPVDGIVHAFSELSSRQSGHGRLDAVVNNIVIEYKHHSKLKTDKQIRSAYEQVKDYLLALAKNTGNKYDAILTDGIRIAYFQFSQDTVRYTKLRQMSVEDIDVIIKAILNCSTKKFEASNIVKDFSISPVSPSETKQIATLLFHNLMESPTEKTKMLYAEWKGLMHLSVDDNGKSNDIEKRRTDLSQIFSHIINETESEYKALFALQTTYAIIVKLIACKVIDNLQFNAETNTYHDLSNLTLPKIQDFFLKMEDGYSYSSMGIRNFLEGDFFSWYADANQWTQDFYEAIKKLVLKVDEYSAFSLNVHYAPIDIFKDLYMSIIPQSIRHSMGEYFTPEWLADCVVTNALNKISNQEWKAIDPCCGSGIFVISLIKKIVGDVSVNELSRKQREIILQQILERVHGIDINPLSVLSARVSYYLAIHALTEIREIEIPVYLGDSAIIPTSVMLGNVDCYAYSVDNLKCKNFDVVLPKRLVSQSDFGKTMSQMQAIVKAEQPQVLYQVIAEKLTEEERQCEELLTKILSLCDSLVYLHRNNWDGIWIRIATNFMMIARLHEFDLIVGNPPWVKWEHLPAAYTKKIKDFCDIRHIFCNDGGMFGGAQLNICALISNVTASNWLKVDGILAFLMPDSIMSQNSYEEFRNFYVSYDKRERLYLQCLDRWMAPLRPFKCGKKSVSQDFNTYYYGTKEIDYAAGVPVRVIGKKPRISDETINACTSYENVRKFLSVDNAKACQLSPSSTAFTYVSEKYDFRLIVGKTAYLYRTGVESTPFEVFKMLGVGKSQQAGHYRFKNKILKTSKYKVDDIPENGWNFPTHYIYPMVEGPSLKPFQYEIGNNYHIIPYDEDKTSVPVALSKLMENNRELALYFANHKNVLDKQSEKSKSMHQGEEFYALSKIGPYTFAPHIVAARDNTYFCASVISPTKTPWGEIKTSVCVKHTIIISQDTKGNFITEDEAHFINGILNSSIVHAYIHSTFKTNGFSLNKSNLFIPKYDANNICHQEIVRLSKMATNDGEQRERIISELTNEYLKICKAENTSLRSELKIAKTRIPVLAKQEIETLKNDSSVKQLIEHLMSVKTGTSILEIQRNCIEQFGEKFPTLSILDWYHFIDDYVKHRTHLYELQMDEMFCWKAAEPEIGNI